MGVCSCQSIIHLTEVDACALNCEYDVSNVLQIEMRRPSVGEGTFQCTFMACTCAALHMVMYIEGIFLKPIQGK